MPVLSIILEGDGAWPDLNDLLREGRLTWLRDVPGEDSGALAVGGLEGGMASGKPSVAIRIDCPDGQVVVAESSLALFLTAADLLRQRYGDPREDT